MGAGVWCRREGFVLLLLLAGKQRSKKTCWCRERLAKYRFRARGFRQHPSTTACTNEQKVRYEPLRIVNVRVVVLSWCCKLKKCVVASNVCSVGISLRQLVMG